MPKKTKPDHILSKLIAEFEDTSVSTQAYNWEEKSFHKLIQYYEKHRLFDKALDVNNAALLQFKNKVDFYLSKAKLLMSLNKPEDAMHILDFATSISSYDTDIPLLKAKAFSLSGRFNEALQIIAELKDAFHEADITELLLVEAFILESMKDFDKMFDTLRDALILNPNNIEALEQIWVSVEFSKKYQESILLHQELIDRNPYSYLAWYNLGHAYSCLGEYEKAVEALEYSFLINPHFEQGYLDCGELCLQISMYEKALDCYTEANEMFGPDAELMVYIAECLIKLDRHREAKQKLQKAIYHDPYNEEIFFYLGECYAKEGNLRSAIQVYLDAIELDDQREEFHASLAKAYEKLGIFGKAESHFRKAAICGQEQSLYWVLYIEFLLKRGNFEKAEKTLIRADKYSFGADLLYCKVAYYFLTNEPEKATLILEEALQENFAMHSILFELVPQIRDSAKLRSMIDYYRAENSPK